MAIRGWSSPVRLPWLAKSGGRLPEPFIRLIQESLPGATLLNPDLDKDLGTFSAADPRDLVLRLIAEVDGDYDPEKHHRIVIVAFSAGTLLARSLFSVAWGAQDDGSFDPQRARPWAHRVTRLVMLAGVTRGWSISTATPDNIRFLAPALLWVVNTASQLTACRGSLISRLKRGAPFVVESRLKFLQVERFLRGHPQWTLPHTVLLVGSRDEFVSPADAMDLGLRGRLHLHRGACQQSPSGP